MVKKALITGITGQDGAYLTHLLLSKGYEVHGIRRRLSSALTPRLDDVYLDPHNKNARLFLHYGDLSDGMSLSKIIQNVRPDEIYNLGAQSHVAVSFVQPEYTSDINAMGTLRILDTMLSIYGKDCPIKYYQASTSELFGNSPSPQSETTRFSPQSPYAIAKYFSFLMTQHYRDAYNFFACNGILFNHESPLRGETFVTRKITRALSRIYLGEFEPLYLGNLDSLRDWGHARDYVEMQWKMLQEETPDDYVIATGEQHSVRQFVDLASKIVGINLEWEGSGESEVGIDTNNGKTIVRVDPAHYRPLEVDDLCGDASKAFSKIGWRPISSFESLVNEMMEYDLALAKGVSTPIRWINE